MATKKASTKRTTKPKVVKDSDLSTREIIAKYDVLRKHVKILTCLSVGIFMLVLILTVLLFSCNDDNCKPKPAKDSDSSTLQEERPEEPESEE